ncbi:cytochrome P450 [Penicillium malachiteum]|uniref:cytochrome P450 n=1 Tax=Penicillium malachiteum TaxID=1324776 RepID=UPI0025491F16|nr:cytochrome P450 [Penicillium malachiteum]KAJ5720789.1 cytochrome P450 [Penicillium malachiteum]
MATNTTESWAPPRGSYSDNELASWFFTAPALLVGAYCLSFAWSSIFGYKFPVFGVKSLWEPIVVSNFRFFRSAEEVLQEGYRACKDKVFQFRRADTDMLVLPPKYVDDIRKLPNHVASPTVAHVHNLMGSSTNMHIILRSNLHFRTLQLKLTPNLNALTRPMQDEVNYAIEHELTDSEDEWVTIKPYHTVLDFVARVSARIFLGLPICRNPEWLEVSTQFTENVFISLVFLRLFPMWTHGILNWLMPSAYKGSAYVRKAKKLLIPEILRRREDEKQAQGNEEEKDDKLNLLSWMMEIATPEESDPASLAHLEVVMSLASIHTSQMNAVHVLYDLLAHPEYLDPIRDEIRAVINEVGPWMSWEKPAFSKLRKLDSFMRESQRFNPPTLLSMHRVLLEEAVLSDGMVLPKGAHISMAVNSIQNDPDVTPEPDVFDGFRYYKLRQREGESHLHQFSTTQERILNFGHGANACPGRFFASLEIKVILVRLLMDYEFKLKPEHGNKRPENLRAHEFIFPNPDAEILMRRRPVSERLEL